MRADYDALVAAVGNTGGRTRTLSDETVCVLFVAVEFIRSRADWTHTTGAPLTNSEWDELSDWIANALEELY